MPEDQSFNGDKWTRQISALLTKLGWHKIADSNIDIEGSDGHMHGIDALFKYFDGYRNSDEGVFLEAKRYSINSFKTGKIQDWITTLAKKIHQLRRSPEFNDTYPDMSSTNPRTGLLALWFHDQKNDSSMREILKRAYVDVKVPQSRIPIRFFVISNDEIYRLISLVDAIEKWDRTNEDKSISPLKFYYPSSMGFGSATQEIPVINVEFMFSRFVLAKSVANLGSGYQTSYAIFHFGNIDIQSIAILKDALLSLNIISDAGSRIYLYLYKRSDDFRKIEPDVKRIFIESFSNAETFDIRQMEILGALPSWMN